MVLIWPYPLTSFAVIIETLPTWRQIMLWPMRPTAVSTTARSSTHARYLIASHNASNRGLHAPFYRSMSSTLGKPPLAGPRENEIYSSVASQLRKEAQKEEENLRASHEQRTAADPRQNSIHDVVLTKILDGYDNIRLLRLELTGTSAVRPEQNHEHSSRLNASYTSTLYRRFGDL